MKSARPGSCKSQEGMPDALKIGSQTARLSKLKTIAQTSQPQTNFTRRKFMFTSV